ncbi:proteophosphoglycan 5 [Lentinula edodes]|uniref:Proteophosphoglycan 5 n=1 Tax=Lentinula edodes TaxID=5353 RepID=A0A1Q3E7E1_LENED|nr:proteophosphoglycan 5 [Lentinula edodes]
MRLTNVLVPVLSVLAGLQGAKAGLIAYGLCQTGCNTVAGACYAAAGFTFGTVIAAPATPAVILGPDPLMIQYLDEDHAFEIRPKYYPLEGLCTK